MRRLYTIQRELQAELPPSDDSQAVRQRSQREEVRRALLQQRAEPVVAALKHWLDEQRSQALPKSPLGQAVGYAFNHWEALDLYVEQGYLSRDHNLSDRVLRAI